jgi:hypothetical protein
VLAVLAAVLPLPALLWLPGGAPQWAGLAACLLWAWLVFCTLAAGCALALDRALRREALAAWFKAHALEQLAWALATVLLWAWIALALGFYLKLGLTPWLSLPVFALLGSLALWSALALLASAAVSAVGAAGRKARLKAALLLPLAYGPQLLTAALLGLLFSGLPAFLFGLKHWSAPIFFAPLGLAPVFTAAFYAAYLVLLVRGLAASAAGGESPHAPGWREIWNPWR